MVDTMKVLFLGEIVSKAGIYCVKTALQDVKARTGAQFVIANGDGATGGFGIGKSHAVYLRKLGVDCITGGDQIYYKKDIAEFIDRAGHMVRAANFPPKNPGRGYRIYTVDTVSIAVLNLLGLSGFLRVHLSNPYSYLPGLVERLKKDANIIVLDYHATTTAEKRIMSIYADGMVSAVMGTGQRVLTSDLELSERGTATITDTGRTGSLNSVAGLAAEVEIEKFLTGIPQRSRDAWDNLELQGVLLDINESGHTASVEYIREPVEPPEGPADESE